MVTGFNAYRIYICIKKIHFNLDNDYNIMRGIVKKDRFLKHWNKIRSKMDGGFFKSVEKDVPNWNTLIRLFATYYIRNPNFYIKDIVGTKLKVFKANESELENLKECVSNDLIKLIKICKDDNIKPKELFNFISLPLIFKYTNEISWNSIIVFDSVFNINESVDEKKLNEIDLLKWLQYKTILINYRHIIKDFIIDVNWKEHIKNIL